MNDRKLKLMMIVSEDWSFWSHRLPLALSAIEAGYDVTLITKVNQLENEIKAKGINVIHFDFVRSSKSPLTDLKNIIKLIRVLKLEKPNVVHNVALKTILIGTIAALFDKNTVVVNAFTGLGYVFSSNQLQARIIRFFIKPVFKLIMKKHNYWAIFQNPDDMNVFKQAGLIVTERATLIRGSGVDKKEFLQTPDRNQTPVVMLASRMLWDKGVGEFIEAARCARRNNTDVKFVLVGDTDSENPMSIPVETLKEWASEGCVTWQGHSNNMPATLAAASIVCLPSYREGLPKVLLEAAAIGRPLIATDVPGCREIVENGKNGILVKLKDIDSLYNAITRLISDVEMREIMGQNSRNLVESKFSTEIINAQTIKLYKTARDLKN